MTKTALIVDDSRSARVVLRRLLEAHSLNVDTTESAEAALDYLNDHRPDVIFMDHMMPGMDGFEAVAAIKKNPATATIPIMMYTSQEGSVYVGQARALGAVGVLPKRVAPVEVSKVLASLRVIDSDDGEEVAARHDEDAVSPAAAGDDRQDREMRDLLQDMFDQQRILLQTEFRDSYRSLAARFAHELRRENAPVEMPPQAPPAPAWYRTPGVLMLAAVALISIALVWQRELTVRHLQQQVAELSERVLSRPGAPLAQDGGQLTGYRQSVQASQAATLDALAWGVNRLASYGFDELPFGESRLLLFQELFDRLVALGFSGVVLVESHVGNFCMITGENGNLELAPPDWPAIGCERTGFAHDEAMARGLRQSVAFANFLNIAEEQTGGAIRFSIQSLGSDAPQTPYPSTAIALTAGEWNTIAAANNRVTVMLQPESGDSQPVM